MRVLLPFLYTDNAIAAELEEEQITDVSEHMTKEMQEMKDAEEENWRAENLLTEADLKMVTTDIPERIQSKTSNSRSPRFISNRFIYA